MVLESHLEVKAFCLLCHWYFCLLGHQVHGWSCKRHGFHFEEHESGKGKCAIYVRYVKNKWRSVNFEIIFSISLDLCSHGQIWASVWNTWLSDNPHGRGDGQQHDTHDTSGTSYLCFFHALNFCLMWFQKYMFSLIIFYFRAKWTHCCKRWLMKQGKQVICWLHNCFDEMRNPWCVSFAFIFKVHWLMHELLLII